VFGGLFALTSHRFDIMNDSPDAFETPRQDEEDTSTATNAVTPARRTLVLNSTGSANSTLTGDSSTGTTRRSRLPIGIQSDDDSDDEEEIVLQFSGVSAGPTYMARRAISNGLVLADVEADENEEGDGGDSDIEGEDGKEFEQAAVEAMEEKLQANADDSNAVAHTEKQYKVLLSRMTSGNLIRLPSPPEDWVAPAPKGHKGEPEFTAVDNPGDWSQFTYRAEFDSKGQYKHHTIPTGAVPVPLKDGQRKLGDWEFHYGGWESPNDCFRKHVTPDNMFPEERKGCLDVDKLTAFGLTKARMKDCDALFFYQLLFPIGDPSRSGVESDRRMPYFTEVTGFTNIYGASEFGMAGTYGHKFKPVSLEEMVQFDGIVHRHGVRGGGPGIHLRWDPTDSDYDDGIYKAMSHTRFLQLK
jgi:hypothetical protein